MNYQTQDLGLPRLTEKMQEKLREARSCRNAILPPISEADMHLIVAGLFALSAVSSPAKPPSRRWSAARALFGM